jgi:hypothetical protein
MHPFPTLIPMHPFPTLIPVRPFPTPIPMHPFPTLIPLHPFPTLIVADDSSLRQAIDVETKRNAGSSRSATKPDAETSHAPTTQDKSGAFYSRYTFIQGKKRVVTLGSCG